MIKSTKKTIWIQGSLPLVACIVYSFTMDMTTRQQEGEFQSRSTSVILSSLPKMWGIF